MLNTTPHDRAVDSSPSARGYTPGGAVLGCDIASAIEVCVEAKAALPADKGVTRTTVVAGSVSAGRAGLRGMRRVDQRHRYPSALSLVPNECKYLREGPAMQATGLLAVGEPSRGNGYE